MAFPPPGAGHHLRKYPPAQVGDTLGPYTVVRLLPRDRTSNERVEWRCTCGRRGTGYVFNLRNAKSACNHEDKFGNPTAYGRRFAKPDLRSTHPTATEKGK